MSVKQRYLALDVMRGLTLALMILVNTPGSWSHVYAPLLHADWHGWTFTDLVFPFFLFIVGAALYFSSKVQVLTRPQQLARIARRSVLLVLLGILLEYYPFTVELSQLRLPGVLQRIGLAFGVAALLQLWLAPRWNGLVIVVILLAYSCLLQLAAEPYGLSGNLVRQLDVLLLGESHLWAGKGLAFDPEGILSTLPAVATVLIGFEAARWLQADQPQRIKLHGLLWLGGLLVALAYLLPEPINKSLWTSTYVLLTGGLALWCLLLLLLVEMRPASQLLYRPFVVLGQNPLFIYALSWLWVRSYGLVPTEAGSLYDSLFLFFAGFLPLKAASLAFALAHLLVLWGIAAWLSQRRIFIKL